MIPITAIVNHLKADTGIAALVGDRVADYDVRLDRNPDYFDYGAIRTCLVVTDAGEVPRFGAPRRAIQGAFNLWVFAPLTARVEVAQLAELAIDRLDDWQDPVSRQLVQYTNQRLGGQGVDVGDGFMDRLIFLCSGMRAEATAA